MRSSEFRLHAAVETSHWWFVGRRRIVRDLLRHILPTDARHIVVDVGCGTGGNLAELATEYCCLGIDPSAEAIDLAQQRFPHVRFLRGQAPDDLGPWCAAADAVLLMDVLEHVADDFELLSRLLAAMRPGAYLLLTVPADPNLWTAHDESFGHYRRYDVQRLARVWDGLPVQTHLLTHYNSRLLPGVRAVRRWNGWRDRFLRSTAAHAVQPTHDFTQVPWPLNRWCASQFAAESAPLLAALSQSRPAYDQGVSLLAVLERLPGTIQPRHKPADVAPDHFDPQAAALASTDN